MYYYIYDSYLADKKNQNTLARIENRLTDLGINGKINRLSFLKNIYQIILDELRRGLKTLVVVGNDKTLNQIINIVHDLNVTIGFIPVGESKIAEALNIPTGEEACDILSARIVEKLDLGSINSAYFISSLETGGQTLSLECDNNYYLTLDNKNNTISIGNLNCHNNSTGSVNDGRLDLIVATTDKKIWGKAKTSYTYLRVKKIRLLSDKPMPILVMDEKRIMKTPATITIFPQEIKMIVGKKCSLIQ